ncbi:MAG: porin [Comamonas sp.]
MKKSLIALAVLASTGAAMAQSSVTLYGRADVNYQWTDNAAFNSGNKWSQQSGGLGGSRIGFRGVEDLGNGLKAGFVIEGSVNIGEGSSSGSANRQSFVSLSGGFGEVRFGKQYTLNDSFAGTYGGAAGTVWGLGATALAHNGVSEGEGRWTNAATYISPNFSGLKLSAQAATKETDYSGAGKAPYAVALDYANGPVGAGFAASKNGGEGTAALYQVGGSYDFGPVALLGAYQYNKNLDKKNAATVGLKAPFGATTLRLTYNWAQQASYTSENDAFNVSTTDTTDTGKIQSLGLGADYKLSKRSTVYAGYNYVKAKNAVYDNKKSVNQVLVGFDHWF